MFRTVEILQYILHGGSSDMFHRIMRDISVPLHQRHGIDFVGSVQLLHDPDYYILVRAFDSPESMSAVLDAFYAGEDLRRGPREDIIRCIDSCNKTVIKLSAESVDTLRVKPDQPSSITLNCSTTGLGGVSPEAFELASSLVQNLSTGVWSVHRMASRFPFINT